MGHNTGLHQPEHRTLLHGLEHAFSGQNTLLQAKHPSRLYRTLPHEAEHDFMWQKLCLRGAEHKLSRCRTRLHGAQYILPLGRTQHKCTDHSYTGQISLVGVFIYQCVLFYLLLTPCSSVSSLPYKHEVLAVDKIYYVLTGGESRTFLFLAPSFQLPLWERHLMGLSFTYVLWALTSLPVVLNNEERVTQ